MKGEHSEKRKEGWEQFHQKYKLDSVRRATIILTVENTLELLKDKREGKVLDIGCGFGEIDILLAQNSDFDIVGCDISKIALKGAQENIKETGLEGRIKLEEGDVYNLKYPNNYFDIVLSFGYVSAATYPGAQKEVVRVLKPGGILICDFINCLSLYKFFHTLKRAFRKKEFPYYISLNRIRQEFEKEDLLFEEQRLFNTYPPIDLKLGHKIFLTFENTVGKVFKSILGRVRLVSFQKAK